MIERFKKEVQETLKNRIYSQFTGEFNAEKYYKIRYEIYELQDVFGSYIKSLKDMHIMLNPETDELISYISSAIPEAIEELRKYTKMNYISIESFIKILEEESVEK